MKQQNNNSAMRRKLESWLKGHGFKARVTVVQHRKKRTVTVLILETGLTISHQGWAISGNSTLKKVKGWIRGSLKF